MELLLTKRNNYSAETECMECEKMTISAYEWTSCADKGRGLVQWSVCWCKAGLCKSGL